MSKYLERARMGLPHALKGRTRSVLAGAALAYATMGGVAAAQDGLLDKLDGFYISGGGTWMFDAHFVEPWVSSIVYSGATALPVVPNFVHTGNSIFDYDTDTGPGGYVAVGYGHKFNNIAPKIFPSGIEFRGEFEASYFKLDVTGVTYTGQIVPLFNPTSAPYKESIDALNFMFNGITSFGITDRIRPYFGVGVGRTRLRRYNSEQAFLDTARDGSPQSCTGPDNRCVSSASTPANQALTGTEADLMTHYPAGTIPFNLGNFPGGFGNFANDPTYNPAQPTPEQSRRIQEGNVYLTPSDLLVDPSTGMQNSYSPFHIQFDRRERVQSHLAYQTMAGVSFALTDNIELRAGYRYLGIGAKRIHLNTHSGEAGLTYKFGGTRQAQASRTGSSKVAAPDGESRLRQKLLGSSGAKGGSRPKSGTDFEVAVGGYYEMQLALSDVETSNLVIAYGGADGAQDVTGADVKRDNEIHFKPAITLDNGIRIGAHVELEGASAEDQIDNAYLYADTSFGRLVLGSENSAGNLMHYSAPDVSILGANDGDIPNWIVHAGGASMATNHELAGGDVERITYFTPRSDGFQFGISYARDDETHSNAQVDSNGNQVQYTAPAFTAFPEARRPDNANIANVLDFGLNWVGGVNGFDMAASARYGIAFADQPEWSDQNGHKPQVWSAGLNLGYGGWTLGGSFGERNLDDQTDGQAFDAGVSYETGPWAFSFAYFHGQNVVDNIYNPDGDNDDVLDDAALLVGNAGIAPYEELTNFVLGVKYQLAKGVDLHGFAGYSIFREDVAVFQCREVGGVCTGQGNLDGAYHAAGYNSAPPPPPSPTNRVSTNAGSTHFRRDSNGVVFGTGLNISF